jgi:hypothetical protein
MSEIIERDDPVTRQETEFELPRRPRRSLASPLTVGLSVVVIGALGFIGGVEVQKRSGPSSSATGGAGARAGAGAFNRGGAATGGTGTGATTGSTTGGAAAGGAGAGAAGGGGGFGGAGGATIGQVANVNGKTIYVTATGGNTIRVRTNKNSKVTRTATGKVGDVHPGDTVIVQGSTASSGTVTATRITATAANAAGGLAGLFGGGGGGGGFAAGGGGAATGSG